MAKSSTSPAGRRETALRWNAVRFISASISARGFAGAGVGSVKVDGFSRLKDEHSGTTGLAHHFGKFGRVLLDRWKRIVVTGDDGAGFKQPGGASGILWTHRE